MFGFGSDFTELKFAYNSLILTGSISQQGVKIRVIKEAKVKPHTTAKDKGDHHSTVLLPTPMSLDIKSTPRPAARGISPTTVVAVVRIIGLILWAAVLTIRSFREVFIFSFLSTL